MRLGTQSSGIGTNIEHLHQLVPGLTHDKIPKKSGNEQIRPTFLHTGSAGSAACVSIIQDPENMPD